MGNECCAAEPDVSKELKTVAKKASPPVKMGEAEDSKYKEEVEQVWREYDKSGTGLLEKQEAFEFLKKTIKEVTGNDPTEDELERNFEIMDEDNSGDIDKEEALKFLKGFRIGHALKALMNDDE